MEIIQQPSRIILSLRIDATTEEWLQVWEGFTEDVKAEVSLRLHGHPAPRDAAVDFATTVYSMLFEVDGTPLFGSVERALGERAPDVTAMRPDPNQPGVGGHRPVIVLAEDSGGRLILGDHLIRGHGWTPRSLNNFSSEYAVADHKRSHEDDTAKHLDHTHPEYIP